MRAFERHRRGILFLYLGVLLALTLAPISLGTGEVGPLDKVAHAILFGVLAGLLYWNFVVTEAAAPAVRAIVLAAACAALVEWLQMRVPRRDGDLDDFYAGVLGAFVTAVVARGWVGYRRRSRPEPEATGLGQSEEAGSP